MRKFLISGVILASLGAPAVAQDVVVFDTPKVDETSITITATGTRSEVEDTGQAVTVFGEADIASVQGPDLTRLLRRAPGVTIARNGGAGSLTAVRVRGAQAEQLLTIIDGVRLADPASPNGGFDYGNLLTGNLAKVELLRGSNSTIWGSDAIGGVLVATTRAASDLAGSVEYGARDSFAGSASGGIGTDAGFIGASGSYYRTDGFSAAANGTEPDGFEQYALTGDGRVYLSDQLELFARGRYADGVLDIDGFPAPAFALADTPEVQETQQLSGAAGVVYDGGPIFVQANYSFADTDRQNFATASRDAETFSSEGRSDRVELRGEWRPIGPLIVNFGAENEWTQYRTAFDTGEDTRILGAYTQLGIEFGGLSGHIGARVDDHRRFGTATSFGADVSYEVVPDLRLRASVGEGFKAPTLFQLFSDFGNEALEPERSTGFDLGVLYGTDTLRAGVTLFRRDSEQLISFIGCFGNTSPICNDRPFGTYDNTGRTRARRAGNRGAGATGRRVRAGSRLRLYRHRRPVGRHCEPGQAPRAAAPPCRDAVGGLCVWRRAAQPDIRVRCALRFVRLRQCGEHRGARRLRRVRSACGPAECWRWTMRGPWTCLRGSRTSPIASTRRRRAMRRRGGACSWACARGCDAAGGGHPRGAADRRVQRRGTA